MQQLLTGIQSSNIPHLGNILGAILPAIHAAKTDKGNPPLFFIADFHTLTSQKNYGQIAHYTKATAAAWLACGLDPNKQILYRQSRIPEVCELAWYLSCHTPYPMLANAHAFKEKANQLPSVNIGLFTYPVLMAADILLYQATHIPVGKDQKQHIEIARDIAKAFNNTQPQPFFNLPQPQINTQIETIPGLDGRKMSKSYHNTISIFDTEHTLQKKISQIKTSSQPLQAPKDPNQCLVFKLYKYIATPENAAKMQTQYQQGGYGYHAAKKELLATILHTFKQERSLFQHYMDHPDQLETILRNGEKKARTIAQTTIQKLRKCLHLNNE